MLDINPFSDISVNMFSHSVGCLLNLLMISFAVVKPFNLMQSHLFIFFFCFTCLGRDIYKKLLQAISEVLLPVFFQNFMVSGLTSKPLIHFEFILVSGVRRWSSFILLHVSVQLPQHHLLNEVSLPHCVYLLSVLNIN